jgi:disulfide bond formation protein DsbB
VDKQTLTDAVSTALAAGAVLLQILLVALAAVALVALLSRRGRRMLAAVRIGLTGSELWLAWGLALVATLGSLYFSEVAGFVPCRLCWFQRIGMYPLAALLLVAAVRRDARGAFAYAIALPVVGALVSAYHVYIELHPEAESGGCKVGVPCSVKWIEEFGFVTIPVLAITAFAAIAALLVLARAGAARRATAT